MCNFSLTVTFGANDFPESKLLYRLPEAAILDPGKAFPLFGEMLQPDKKKQMPTVKHIFFNINLLFTKRKTLSYNRIQYTTTCTLLLTHKQKTGRIPLFRK